MPSPFLQSDQRSNRPITTTRHMYQTSPLGTKHSFIILDESPPTKHSNFENIFRQADSQGRRRPLHPQTQHRHFLITVNDISAIKLTQNNFTADQETKYTDLP